MAGTLMIKNFALIQGIFRIDRRNYCVWALEAKLAWYFYLNKNYNKLILIWSIAVEETDANES